MTNPEPTVRAEMAALAVVTPEEADAALAAAAAEYEAAQKLYSRACRLFPAATRRSLATDLRTVADAHERSGRLGEAHAFRQAADRDAAAAFTLPEFVPDPDDTPKEDDR